VALTAFKDPTINFQLFVALFLSVNDIFETSIVLYILFVIDYYKKWEIVAVEIKQSVEKA
jgi:hypothetical protein